MKNLRHVLATAAALLLAPAAALAQTAPNWTFGYVPTTAQWNAAFASKQDALGYVPMNVAGGTFTGRVVTAAPGASTAGLNLTPGTAPTSPTAGDIWITSSGFFARVGGTTVGPLTGSAGGSFAGTAPISVSFPSSVVTYSIANGTSVANPGTGTLETLLPIQTTAGASKTFAAADLFKETRRSNSGSAMTDTFPASSATGMVNGAKIVVTNVDATAGDTITAGAGTTIGGSAVVAAGRAIQYVYDQPNTTWRPTLNTGTALLGPVTNNAVAIGSSTSNALQYASPPAVLGCLSSTGTGTPPSFGSSTFSQCGPVSYVSTIAGLRTVTISTTPNVYVNGYYGLGDGGGGWFYADTIGTCTDNGGTCIAPNVGSGRWMRNFQGQDINVRWFGAKGDGATSDTAVVANALTAAIAARGGLYLPATSSCYVTNIDLPDHISGLRIFGDSQASGTIFVPGGSIICASSSAHAINMPGSNGGTISDISIENLKVINSGSGDAINATNVIQLKLDQLNLFSSSGVALNLVGTGDYDVRGVAAYGGAGSALEITNSSITAAGPGVFTGGQFALQGNTSSTCVVLSGSLSVVFNGTLFTCRGPNLLASVKIDGQSAYPSTQYGTAVFNAPHGESNYNFTDTGADFLIGSTTPAANVQINGYGGFGQGDDGSHVQRDGVRIVAALSVAVRESNFNNLGAPTGGFTRAAIRIESTFSGSYDFRNNTAAVTGSLYSDANGRCIGTANCSGGGQIIDSLTLGTPLLATSGGTGFASYAVGDLLYANTTTTLARLADAATGSALLSGGVGVAPAWGKVTYSVIQNLGALAVMGRSTNSSGVGADIQATAASGAVLRESGGTIGFGTIATAGIADNAVTLAKLATQGANTALVNVTSGSAVPTAQTVSSCSTASSALNWTTNTGFGCNTSITAASMPTTGLTGTLQAAQEPAHTGDVTNSAGSLTTVLANIPTGVPAAGSILFANIAAPSSPASGKVSIYSDSTDLRFHDKNASGVIGTTVVADTGASNNFLTAISASGAVSKAQPTFSNLATGTAPAFTLGGTVSGGGNQINNVVIGTSTPLAGSFTTLSASTSITSPLHIGGAGTTGTQLTLQTTTGSGTTDAIAFKGGNNGGTTFGTWNATGLGLGSVAADSLLTVNANTGAAASPPAGTYIHVVGADGVVPRITIDAYAAVPVIAGQLALGTQASKVVVSANTNMFTIAASGWTGSANAAGGQLSFFSRETFSGTASGTSFSIYTTPLTTTGVAESTRNQPSGGFAVGATAIATDKGIGTVALDGNLFFTVAAKTVTLKQGANGAVGTFVCTSGGTITISNTNVAVTDAIVISLNTVGGSISTNPTVNAITASTSFTAKCATSDTSTYNYAIIKNAA